MRVEAVWFNSGGVRCAGDLYLPSDSGPEPKPGLVLGHSGAMVKEALAVPASRFAEAGFVALAIDYRTIGSSEGEPRGQNFPERQVDDFRSGLSYLQSHPQVDPERLGVWGVSVGGSVAIQAAVLDRRVKAVAVQSPSVMNGWRYLQRYRGREAFHAMRGALQQDWQLRYETGNGAVVPFLDLSHEEAHKAQEAASQLYPSFRNEVQLESAEHTLLFAPENVIEHLAPTPLLMVANGGYDPYHSLDEVQSAYAKAGEPKRLVVLPYDVLGLYAEPGLSEALGLAIDWYDEHLRRARLAVTTVYPEGVPA